MEIVPLVRKIAIISAIATLCAMAAGCATDLGGQGTSQANGHQLRYYGGPKSPMWVSQ
jgi:hypothetical protein